MKKIKWLIPVAALSAVGGITPAFTSCKNNETVKTYDVAINSSNKFTYDTTKIGTNKAESGRNFEIAILAAANYQIDKTCIEVKSGDTKITDFTYNLNTLVIPSASITGNISITVTPVLETILDIDSETLTLKGFLPGITTAEIEEKCKGTLIIPIKVMFIANNAFYDATNDKTLIPDSITNLVFEEDIHAVETTTGVPDVVGFAHLHDAAGQYGIGESAFRKSPFKHVKLPIGSKYTVGTNAFRESKIEILEMPHPGYVSTEEEAALVDYPIGTIKGWVKTGWSAEQRRNLFTERLTNFGFLSFGLTENLKSISFTPFVSKEINNNVFGMTEEEVGGNNPATILDFTKWNYRQLNNENFDYSQINQWVTDRNDFSTNYSPLSDLTVNFGQFRQSVGESEPKEKVIYVITEDEKTILSQSPTGDDQWHDRLLAMLGLYGQSLGWHNKYTNVVFIPSSDNYSKSKQGCQSAYDYQSLVKTTSEISLTPSKAKDNYQEISLTYSGSGKVNSAIETYGLKGDFEFEITNSEWTKGTPVDLKLKHIKRTDLDPSEQADYNNNKFTVLWEDGKAPQVGDSVKLTFNIHALHMMRDTIGLELTLNFVE